MKTNVNPKQLTKEQLLKEYEEALSENEMLKEQLKSEIKANEKLSKSQVTPTAGPPLEPPGPAQQAQIKAFLEELLAYIKISQGQAGDLPLANIRIINQIKTRLNTALGKLNAAEAPLPEGEEATTSKPEPEPAAEA